MELPIVSVICFVYNHEKYLREALNGFLMQKINFQYEVVIHDDASTDNSASIIKEYEEKYPEIIKPIYQTENQYSLEKGRATHICFSKAKGKYIAMCEGDDYWTDPLKLQKQVDFLEANPDYVICGHQRNVIKNNLIISSKEYKPDLHTQCILFRNMFPDELFFNYLFKVVNADTFLYLYLKQFGKSKVLNFNGANYRFHESGVWSPLSLSSKLEKAYKNFDPMIEYFQFIKNKPLEMEARSMKYCVYLRRAYLFVEKNEYKKSIMQWIFFNKELIETGFFQCFKMINIKRNISFWIVFVKKYFRTHKAIKI